MSDKQRQLDELKRGEYGSRLNTERTEEENNENDEFEQIHHDLEDIKSFVKNQMDEEEFEDRSRFQRSLSRPRLKENSFNEKIRKAGLEDKRILENKRREILKNIRKVEDEEEAYNSDDQK